MSFVPCVTLKVIFPIIQRNICRVLVSRLYSKMSETLNQVPDVDIDDNGVFKYILINVEDKKSQTKKPIVRGYSRAGYHDQTNSGRDSNKSTGKMADGTYSSTAAQISSSNRSGAQTSIVHEYDESVEIKEEIIDDQERHQSGEHNLLSEKNQLDEKFISSDNSTVKTENVYEYDETLEIKEEIIQDPGAVTDQTLSKKYESTLNTVDTRETDILSVDKLRNHEKKKIQDQKPEPGKKYKCEKCARSYKYKKGLSTHQKFECGLTPQFICKFCGKQFRQSSHVSRHVRQLHQLQARNNCDKCSLSYISLDALKLHNRLKHAAVKPQFVCDVCGFTTSVKSSLSSHVTSHDKTSQAKYNCDKCSLNYSSLFALKRHNRLKHAAVKPDFICAVCSFKTNVKSSLSTHIALRHKTSQARISCDRCSLSYSSLDALKRHNRLKHAAIKAELICDVFGFKTNVKSGLSTRTALRHKTSQARYNCDKCSRSYGRLSNLKEHVSLKHAVVKPKFASNV